MVLIYLRNSRPACPRIMIPALGHGPFRFGMLRVRIDAAPFLACLLTARSAANYISPFAPQLFQLIEMESDNTVRLLILPAFIFSGAAALIYEVTWMRALSIIFGLTICRMRSLPCSLSLWPALHSGAISGGGRFADMLPPLVNPAPFASLSYFKKGILLRLFLSCRFLTCANDSTSYKFLMRQ